MKVLLAAGGSGGHIFPAVALARQMAAMRPDLAVEFIASDKPLDRRILENEGLRHHLLSANGLPYRITWRLIPFGVMLAWDLARSFVIIRRMKPLVVVGFGGYVSFPVLFAALVLGIKRVAHEQNVVPGRANAVLFKLAHKIAVSFEETKSRLGRRERLKAVFTGNPVRSEMALLTRAEALRRLGLKGDHFTVFVIGGSQGSRRLNEAVVKALEGMDGQVKGSIQVLHITGRADYEEVAGAYRDMKIENRVWSFIDRIEEAYSAADLIITRSGASAIFEIALFGKPMMLVPYRFALNHQAENASVFSRSGAAMEMKEENLSPEAVREKILDLRKDPARLAELGRAARRMSVPDASEKLAREIFAAAGG